MYKKTAITTLFFLLISYTAISQKQLNSPFSRFNIGTLEPQGSFKSRGMGGVGVAMRDNNSIHYMNPASYSSLDTNSFSFDFGVDFGINTLKQGDNKYSTKDMNFNHLIMGFPIAKNWGVATGIVPVSHGYYNISNHVDTTDNNYDPVTGNYYSFYEGKGGFSNFFLGTGVNIFKNLSLGVNMTIMFGTLERKSSVIFEDIENNFYTSTSEKMKINGINFEYGLQYITKLKDDYFLNAGFTLISGKSYKSGYDYFAKRESVYNTYSPDTLDYVSETAAPVKLPQMYKAGVAFGKPNKFTVGFDFVAIPWSKSDIPGIKNYAANTVTYALGVEFIPEKYSNSSILKRIEYRFGGHLGDNYLTLGGYQLKEKGVSFGLGIPLRRSLSRVNLFIDYTQKSGSKNSELHTENITTIGGSLNFYDFWFFKRRYN